MFVFFLILAQTVLSRAKASLLARVKLSRSPSTILGSISSTSQLPGQTKPCKSVFGVNFQRVFQLQAGFAGVPKQIHSRLFAAMAESHREIHLWGFRAINLEGAEAPRWQRVHPRAAVPRAGTGQVKSGPVCVPWPRAQPGLHKATLYALAGFKG